MGGQVCITHQLLRLSMASIYPFTRYARKRQVTPDVSWSERVMVVRIVIGLVLVAFFALGGAVLLYGTFLHFRFTDTSDPVTSVVGGWLWLAYFAALDLLWGASAVSLLWPGRRSAQLTRVLGVGAIAAWLSGGAILAALYMYSAGRFYMELAGLILLGAITAGIGQAWLSRQATA